MKIPDEGRVARYCSPDKNNKNNKRLPYLTAFLLKREKDEKFLSASWLQQERQLGTDGSLNFVRKAFESMDYTLKPDGRFAILSVGAIRDTLHGLSVEHLPNDADPWHSGIFGSYGLPIEREREIATELRDLVSDQDVYPAIIPES